MEDITGTFANKKNNVKITLSPDKSYLVTGLGLDGSNSFSGRFGLKCLMLPGFHFTWFYSAMTCMRWAHRES
jgi:hypothetical protein